MALSEEQLRNALGEAMVDLLESQTVINQLKEKAHPALPELQEKLDMCRESNQGLSTQSEARLQTLRDQDKEIKELKDKIDQIQAERNSLRTQLQLVQAQVKKQK